MDEKSNSQKKIINLFSNRNHKSFLVSNQIKKKFENKGYEVSEKYNNKALLNICVGGDGAFLRAVHNSCCSIIPFVGINTGNLGFYQEILTNEIDEFVERFISGDYEIDRLSLVEARVHFKNSKKIARHYAINEFLVRAKEQSIVHLDVFIDGNHLETFAGDALIISTPSGSTAYNFAAGGSILYNTLKGYQLTHLAPINSRSYRSLSNSVILPSNAVLKTEVTKIDRNNEYLLIIDGINKYYKRSAIDYIEFGISKKHINKLVFNKNWYWLNIKDKFL